MFEADHTNAMAKDIQKIDTTLARTTALIPIAAHQELHSIEPAIEQYAKQEAREPFSVVLYPNAPFGEERAADRTIDKIDQMIERFPDLDLRRTELGIHEKETIGSIRRSLWSAALLLGYVEGMFDSSDNREPLGINHDIDTSFMSPRYMQHIRNHWDRQERRYAEIGVPSYVAMPVQGSLTSHAYDVRYPNSSQATLWYDFAFRQMKDQGSYEAGIITSLTHYAKSGGFQGDAQTHETSNLVKEGDRASVIPGTILKTSSRRFVERLHSHTLADIWSDDSFGAKDKCRDDITPYDISQDRKEEVIVASLDETQMPYIFDPAYRQAINHARLSRLVSGGDQWKQEFKSELERRKKMAVAVLDWYVEAPIAASLVESSYNPARMVAQIS